MTDQRHSKATNKNKETTLFGLSINDRYAAHKAFGAVVIVWLLFWIGISIFVDQIGVFGDQFGAPNSLFTGLAFAGIIYTILMQKEELRLQRKELKLTREEMKLARYEFEGQNETLRLQRFENTFFNMLSLHNNLMESATFNRQYLFKTIDKFPSMLHSSIVFTPTSFQTYQSVFRSFFSNDAHHIDIHTSAYLQSLKSLYHTIKTSALISHDQQQEYFLILKNNISLPERRFLYYYVTLGAGESNHPYIEEIEKTLDIIGSVGTSSLLHPSHNQLLMSYRNQH